MVWLTRNGSVVSIDYLSDLDGGELDAVKRTEVVTSSVLPSNVIHRDITPYMQSPLGRTVRICGQGQALVRSSTQPSWPLRAARGNVGNVISGMVNGNSSWALSLI